MRLRQQLVIDRDVDLSIIESALNRYLADLEITIARFPESKKETWFSHPSNWFEERAEYTKAIIERLEALNTESISSPAGEGVVAEGQALLA